MDRDTRFFLLSGFISLSFFIGIVFILLYFLNLPSKTKVYALKKDTYVSISLSTMKQKKHVQKKDLTKPITSTKQVKELKKDTDIEVDDLFSDVWTKKVTNKPVKKVIDEKRLAKISKRLPTSKVKNTQSIEIEKVQPVDEDDKPTVSTGYEINEYIAEIQAIVTNVFNQINRQVKDGLIALGYMELSALGKLIDFRILRYSEDAEFNKACDELKAILSTITFPQNPENRSFSLEINIKTEK